MRVPPLISTPEAVKTELDLLKALEDIEAAFSIIKKKGKTVDMHPVDKNYDNLKCEIKPIPAGDKMEKVIKDYVRMTHAPTHNSYDLEVLQAFELNKSGEVESFCDYGTRRLLWHGSRITNWMGILGRGLKIAPPEAPSTGYMFGKGVYFADCASKSANYTYPTSREKVGIMALCEVCDDSSLLDLYRVVGTCHNYGRQVRSFVYAGVIPCQIFIKLLVWLAMKKAGSVRRTEFWTASVWPLFQVSLGEINPLMNADYNANQLPKGKHSVQGVGRNIPDPSTWITLDDGVVVPCGKLIESKVENATLWYNEFIVYDVRQIRLRYLVQLKFKYNY
ncbi:unnamed protein product [Taenia asiatica]|uniref:Poly [ADP-ribose] polymerase n=1 Tax=Taenia asiatica TaxID=60517 RepID=A0A0R3WGC2_TAEAS|nr:unnamed protein product [Taenia asiatica]